MNAPRHRVDSPLHISPAIQFARAAAAATTATVVAVTAPPPLHRWVSHRQMLPVPYLRGIWNEGEDLRNRRRNRTADRVSHGKKKSPDIVRQLQGEFKEGLVIFTGTSYTIYLHHCKTHRFQLLPR